MRAINFSSDIHQGRTLYCEGKGGLQVYSCLFRALTICLDTTFLTAAITANLNFIRNGSEIITST